MCILELALHRSKSKWVSQWQGSWLKVTPSSFNSGFLPIEGSAVSCIWSPTNRLQPRVSIGQWLRSLLKVSGVDTDIFKAHSVHGASTTAAANSNIPLSEILTSTFHRFYYKPIHCSLFSHAAFHWDCLQLFAYLVLSCVCANLQINNLLLLTFVLFISL